MSLMYNRLRRTTSKYGATRCQSTGFPELAGRSFASKLERTVAEIHVLMQRAGDIENVRFQPLVTLWPINVNYHPDLSYRDRKTGAIHYVEAKGFETERWRVIREIWRVHGVAPLHIWVQGRRGPMTREVITPSSMEQHI